MFRSIPRTGSALVFALAAGVLPVAAAPAATPKPLSTAHFQALKAQQPLRVAQAQSHLMAARDQLGLGADAGFQLRTSLTNPQGRTIARFTQSHQGRRVWGGEVITHVEADGAFQPLAQGVKTGITLTGGPRLTAEQAQAIALHSLAAKGALKVAPKVEQVVFPSKYTGGLKTVLDDATHREVLDTELSTWAKAPQDPYVWAYEVRTLLMNKVDGHKEINFIIDGTTGAILRKWSGLQRDTPVTNAGKSLFRGTVPISAAQAADGTYSLNAMDRGSLPQPFAAEQGVTQVGMTTYYAYYDVANFMNYSFTPYAGHASSTWGDGNRLPYPWNWNAGLGDDPNLWDFDATGNQMVLRGMLGPAGETNAVDAHFGICATWDFYKNVFNRSGVDDLDTSVLAVVGDFNPFTGGAFPDNAYWSPWTFGMHFGEGSYDADHNPEGLLSLTELDITGHELSHGVMEYSGGFIYQGRSGGLNEGNSDFFGKMVQAYINAGATGSSIPNFTPGDLTQWEVGHNSAPAGAMPFRFMYKPSLDGISADGDFDGIDMLDVHYSSGVFNRCMFFLTTGASANASDPTHSVFLPGGMTGIGNDKAARIWYKALTEYLGSDTDFKAARAGSIQAAQDLYGAGSPEEAAVWKAWAAVNVGPSVPGEAAKVWVSWPVTNPEGSFFWNNSYNGPYFSNLQLYPTRTAAKLAVDVANTTNTQVTFTMGKPNETWQAGHISADGVWTTPSITYYGDIIRIKATSQADPTQFAMGKIMLAEIDANQDTDVDAFDMGFIAMNWGLTSDHMPKVNADLGGDYFGVNDWDLVLFGETYGNGFRVQ